MASTHLFLISNRNKVLFPMGSTPSLTEEVSKLVVFGSPNSTLHVGTVATEAINWVGQLARSKDGGRDVGGGVGGRALERRVDDFR